MKPFTDGDYVKDCLMAVVEVICPEKKKLFSDVSLSARTVTRRIEEMSQDVKTGQHDCLKNLQYFSIAIDESTDTTDTAQLTEFVRGVSSNFDIFEDFVELVPMKGTTTGADILKALLQCTNRGVVRQDNKLDECYGHSGESCEYDFVSQTESPTVSPDVTRSRESIW
ncbi:general transcription factor II-I repeat domain-containing protein 2-like [Clavelina lepadiformis]|uniref:general transcription factor II-I repeat domain-containing protein 2-like n=1 Tax=Clavelina lepadiformis TaxID=159417 RepID=UPI0040422439